MRPTRPAGTTRTGLRRRALVRWLDAPVSDFAMTLVRLGATAAFVAVTEWMGGATPGDAYVVMDPSWAVASGHLACAYPSQTSGAGLVPPFYPLVTGLVAALARIGHHLPFPSDAMLGTNCSHALAAMNRWAQSAGAVNPTLALGYLSWLALVAGAVALVRSLGRGRQRWEGATLVALALTPPVAMSIGEYFHPQDLLAVSLVLGALSLMLRQRWTAAGVLIGLALCTQQLATLAALPLVLVTPWRELRRLLGGAIAAAVLVDLPFVIASSGRALSAIVVGTGATAIEGGTLLDELGVSAHATLLLARSLPLALTAATALWALARSRSRARHAASVVALVMVGFALRLVFEVNLYGYYLMPVAVAFVIYLVAAHEPRGTFAAWVVVVIGAAWTGGLAAGPAWRPLPVWFWQVPLAAIPLAVAWRHLARVTREGETGAGPSASP